MALEWQSTNQRDTSNIVDDWDQWLTFEGIEEGRVYRLEHKENPLLRGRKSRCAQHSRASGRPNLSTDKGIPSHAKSGHRRSRSNGQLVSKARDKIDIERTGSQSFDDCEGLRSCTSKSPTSGSRKESPSAKLSLGRRFSFSSRALRRNSLSNSENEKAKLGSDSNLRKSVPQSSQYSHGGKIAAVLGKSKSLSDLIKSYMQRKE